MSQTFEMVAKTFQGLEDVLAAELQALGATDVNAGRRMVSFTGTKETLYKANLWCRSALRILKPFYKFTARDTDQLYELTKRFDWGSVLTLDSTFAIDTVTYSDEFSHSRFVTYRVKDAIVDWFQDRYGAGKRPGVRLELADVIINVHISGNDVTLSLDSSGESLHKRGYRVAQTEAPINEVLAAGIILKTGWTGQSNFVDPMCGSGTFLIEAALIAANIPPGIYRRNFAFERWPDFDAELYERLYNDDSAERPFEYKIYGSDISKRAIEIAERNIKSAGVARMISLEAKPLSAWDEAPQPGIMVTNPPYGERISTDDMEGLYRLLGSKLKNVFKGYHAWIIAAKNDFVHSIGLAPSQRIAMLNGSIECELLEYVIFEGDYKSFRRQGGSLHEGKPREEDAKKTKRFSRRGDDKPSGAKTKASRESKKFGRGAKPSDRTSKDFRKGKTKPFGNAKPERKPYDDKAATDAPSENPLAQRRNEKALLSIVNKQPSLPAVNMRQRRKKS